MAEYYCIQNVEAEYVFQFFIWPMDSDISIWSKGDLGFMKKVRMNLLGFKRLEIA